MKIFIFLILSILASSQCSLLEMSKNLWTHLLSGGLTKSGALDPLRVPVIKVDQSEGDTSYRIVLRNVEIKGLNFSSPESVHIARGRLKSNLSEQEAGYVSYNELKDLDSVRYRFHTLVKAPKTGNGSQKAQTKEPLSQFLNVPEPGVSEYVKFAQEDFHKDGVETRDIDSNCTNKQNSEVSYKSKPNSSRVHSVNSRDNSSNVDIVYAEKYENADKVDIASHPTQRSNILTHRTNDKSSLEGKRGLVECTGACRRRPDLTGGKYNPKSGEDTSLNYDENVERFANPHSGHQEKSSNYDDAQVSASERFELEQKYLEVEDNGENKNASTSQVDKNHRYQTAKNFNQKNPVVYRRGHHYQETATEGKPISTERFEESDDNEHSRVPSEETLGDGIIVSSQILNKENHYGQIANDSKRENVTIYSRGHQIHRETPEEGAPESTQRLKGSNGNHHSGVPFENPLGYVNMKNPNDEHNNRTTFSRGHQRYQETTKQGGPEQKLGYVTIMSSKKPNYENNNGQSAGDSKQQNPTIHSRGHRRYQETLKEEVPESTHQYEERNGKLHSLEDSVQNHYPRVHSEKKPGYVDIVYADNTDQKIKHFGNLKVNNDPESRFYGLDEIIRGLHENARYVIHNFTAEESITKRNNMAKAASDSERIKDMIRYAQQYQEDQGYFEQGMQLVYHFGGTKPDDSQHDVSERPEVNDAKRGKREYAKDDAEDDVMHVILRLRVPILQVRANYVLTGKVGKEVVRGNGLLTATFTGLIGDFTIELKKVDENLMIVRAARAKLVAAEHKVVLQGMNDRGPVESILVHGLMAAEAVAAMLADDLATKALSEKTADSMVYKMYKNAPPG